MGKLAKEFTDIINEQDFCFDPHEMQVIQMATDAINEWKNSIKDAMDVFIWEIKNTNVNLV